MDTKKLRQKILDLAIRGKLVPQDPNDEPASVLLERIQAEKEQLIKNGKIKRSKKSASSDTYPYENVPFEIPENWVWTTIGEVFNLQAGRFVEASQIYSDSTTIHPYPCFGGNGLRGYVSDYNREGIFPIIGRQGALCGNINLASSKFYATEHAIVVETFCNMNCYWSSYVLKFLNLNQYATATAQPGLSVKTVNEVCIPIPPLSEQARIVNAIGDWFAIIDKIEQEQIDLTCAIKQTKSKILDLAIHGKLVPQDPNDEPAIELLRRINPSFKPCDNAHYKCFPNNWVECTVNDVFDVNPKISAEDDMEAAFISMANIEDSFSNKYSYILRKWSDIKKGYTHFQDNDIAVAKISPCLENRKSAVFTKLPNSVGGGTTELNIFRSEIVAPLYGLYFFKSDYFISNCTNSFNGVVGQQRVATSVIKDMIFCLPRYAEQKRIVAKIEELFVTIDKIKESLEA